MEALEATSGSTAEKSHWLRRIIITLVVLGVLIGGAEWVLRTVIPDVIAGAVRSQLKLTKDHPVDVTLSGFALGYALTGKVGNVEIHVDDAPLVDGVQGQVDLKADSVPFNPLLGKIKGGSVALTLNKDQIGPVVELVTRGFADSGSVQGDEVVVARTMTFFGQEVPISASLQLSVEDGDVLVNPGSLKAVGFELTSEQLAAYSAGALDQFLTPQTVCVKDQLPKGLTLTGIEASSTGSITVTADLAEGVLSNYKERQPGTCA